MSISVKARKQKGRALQQWVRDEIIARFKDRGVDPEDCKSTSMGASGEDVQLSPFARTLFPYSVECKSHKSMAVYKYYEQACGNSNSYEPLLVIKINNRKPLVVVDAEHFLDLTRGMIND